MSAQPDYGTQSSQNCYCNALRSDQMDLSLFVLYLVLVYKSSQTDIPEV